MTPKALRERAEKLRLDLVHYPTVQWDEKIVTAFTAVVAEATEEKDKLLALQRAALDVWKQAHPHEQSPGACSRAIAEARRAQRERAEQIVQRFLVYDSQRAVSWHEVQDCLAALRAQT